VTRAAFALRLTWGSYLLLLLQQALDAALMQPPPIIWAFKLVPLLLFLPGMRRDNLRSFIWLCFVCLGYFMVLVQRLFATPADPVAITGMVAVVVLFTFAMLYVRWRARELRSQSGHRKDEGEGPAHTN
jgi:uncharacterized membrane protein